ncbi:tRNA 5-methylaminomethyl-2-thiouridine biosynthesis bifunctional protein [Polaromonas sp. OV174]|uniref:FAD-dependent 5-carboxymethylaminomethyl-2-thiouridine(34) oxidoreductase MnmC n=1 Tax=Polaromonas sp. OV174 TaxID=1855300 RepID=UPI0008E49485|nr:FAD-dependent 5-carboxymethylaminomethyl-2-thiouridine(34) oxidoreductase MnmC [Polaromonas sp. OV174]SFC67308.1 tRNA 5-methylaminomethyl-2-thiouridine biosynthesis bifunctional protein [Polaromonas sp. OV174]
MAEVIEWLADGTAGGSPYSPRFGDRYRSELGGLEQAREVFLKGCGLPAAWASQPQWTILETGFGLGLNFLVSWAAWKADPQRPRLLHFVSTEAFPASAEDVLRSARTHPELLPLAQELQAQLWGLLPGMHRLVFEDGQLLLTLCIGDAKAMLREQSFAADSVYLDGFSPQRNPDIWDLHTFKAVARCCRRGTRVATWTVARSVRDALAQAGFVVEKVPGIPPKRDNLQGEYNPAWEPKKTRASPLRRTASSCVVIGAGLAGAAVAASLARRGWQVTVLDAADTPAAGASGLPAGVLAPHVSPDDSLLSRLSRCGVRATLQQAGRWLQAGQDWSPSGVLEHCVEHERKLPHAWQPEQAWASAAGDWTRLATPEQLAQCGLPPKAPALWHVQAGWIKPACLVRAWLSSPGVSWRGNAAVSQLTYQSGAWRVLDASGQELAQAELVVLAAGHASRALAETAQDQPLALQAIRGQVSWARHEPTEAGTAQALPAFPVNGHGSLIPAFPHAAGLAWITGGTFERDKASADIKPQDHKQNFGKLQTLLPQAAQTLASQFDKLDIQAWAGTRCATPSRLPALGPLQAPDLWLCSGMGSRGLSFAALCAELLAARLHAEPLPLEQRLAEALLPAHAALTTG